ncbi:hypothetical protein R3P38DRAFT_3260664 [Favolaschia claudopus]|uniref:DUF6534 domain-containing protein n=1 Tax=Favolaschia claudopus TaxID=2862362 RepID=A0AAW0CWU4_9AGAR
MFDKVIGAILFASWANGMLFIVGGMQTYKYFANFPNDHWATKAAVWCAVSVDVVSIMANYAQAYLYMITHWGDLEYLFASVYWPMYLYVLTTGLSAFIVQNYLIFRYWRATKYAIVCVIIWFISATGLVGALLTLVVIIQSTSNEAARSTTSTMVIIWLVGATAADVALAIALVFQLRKMQSAFTATQSILHRLIRSAIQTGTITSVMAVITMVLFLADNESNVTLGFGYPLGRVYTITLLYNLNMRKEMRGAGISRTRDTSSGGGNGPHGHGPSGERGIGLESLGGIHIHRTAIVKIDDSDVHKAKTEIDQVSVRTQKEDKF